MDSTSKGQIVSIPMEFEFDQGTITDVLKSMCESGRKEFKPLMGILHSLGAKLDGFLEYLLIKGEIFSNDNGHLAYATSENYSIPFTAEQINSPKAMERYLEAVKDHI